MSKRLKNILLVLGILIVSIALDQYTKHVAYVELSNHPSISYWDGFFILTYVENEGAFLSMGSGLPEGLRILLLTVLPAILLTGMMIYVFKNRTMLNLERWAIALIAGGGIGNIIDRLAYGKVVDFMNMGIGNLRTGIFNVADVYIMVGIGLFLLAYFKQQRMEKAAAAEAAAAAETEVAIPDDNLSDSEAENP